MKKAKKVIFRPPEDSIPFRLGVLAATILGVTSSCLFVHTSIAFTCLYIWAIITGSYVSYYYRRENNPWITWVVVLGTIGVVVYCVYEVLMVYESGPLALLIPIIHQLAGMLALHSFEMKSRYELNTAALISLLLLCVSAPVARGIDFGVSVLAYICIGALVLYFDNQSFTLRAAAASGPAEPTATPQIANLDHAEEKAAVPVIKNVAIVAILPLVSVIAFMLVPRNDFLFDWLSAEIKKRTEGVSLGEMLKLTPHKGIGPPVNLRHEFYLPSKPKALPLSPQKPKDEQKPPKGGKGKPKKPEKAKPTPKKPEEKKEPNKKPPEKDKQPPKKPEEKKEPNKKPPEKDKQPPKKPEEKKEPNKKPPEKDKQTPNKSEKGKQPLNKSEKDKQPPDKSEKDKQPPEKKEPAKDKPPEQPPENQPNSTLNTNIPMDKGTDLLFKLSANRTVYSRQNCFDYFDGQYWSTTDQETKKTFLKPLRGSYDLSHCDYLQPEQGFASASLMQDYSIEKDLGTLMPVGGMPQKIEYDSASLSVDVYRRILTPDPLRKGQKYKVFGQLPVYDQKQMRQAAPLPAERETKLKEYLVGYLQLPEGEDTRTADLAHQVGGKGGNWFHQCELITQYLRKNYRSKEDKAPGPEGENTVDRFLLERKEGDCKDFATAFVVLCRIDGIPARVVSGYTPGKTNTVSGLQEIRLTDRHVWGEAYIPGYDWVPFDAVPSGYLPDRPPENNYSLSSIQKKFNKVNDLAYDQQQLKNFWQRIKRHIPAIIACTVTLILLIGSLFLARKRIINWFRERGRHPARKIYFMVMGKLKKAKIVKFPSETTTEFVRRLNSANNVGQGIVVDKHLTAQLNKFFDTYAAVYFGDQPKMSQLEQEGNSIVEHLKAGNRR